MGDNNIFILGVKVSRFNFNEVLEEVEKYFQNYQLPMTNDQLKAVKPLIIFTPNPEIVVYAQKDKRFKKIVNSAQINIPDGWGLVWASRFFGEPLGQRITGADLMEKLVKLAAQKGLTVGLIGGKEGVAVRALECLKKKYPGFKGWAEEGPEIKLPMTNFQYPIKSADIIFVGMGCPKQEYYINEIAQLLNCSIVNNVTMQQCNNRPLVLMAVGGAFDYLAGEVPRAPLFMRLMGLEWFFRLCRQPWRLKRQLALVKFIWLVIKQKV